MDGLLGPTGSLTSPVMCIYRLVDGSLLYSKTASLGGDGFWTFILDETAIIKMEKKITNGAIDVSMSGLKMSDPALSAPFNAKTRRVPSSAILYIEDCSNPEALKQLESLLSKILRA